MNSYLQKIAARSGGSAPVNPPSVPIAPAKAHDMQDRKPGASDDIELRKVEANAPVYPAQHPVLYPVKTDHRSLPVKEGGQQASHDIPAVDTNEMNVINPSPAKDPLQPSTVYNTIRAEKSTVIKTIEQTKTEQKSSVEIKPVVKEIQAEEIHQKAVAKKSDTATNYFKLRPEMPLYKADHLLSPVQPVMPASLPENKIPLTNKLVIGRLTVEIVKPVQPALKLQAPVTRKNSSPYSSNRDFIGTSKQSFGLGQS